LQNRFALLLPFATIVARLFAMKLLLAGLLFSSTILAADYSGTYTGVYQGSSGKVENKLVLKMKGNTLTGTLKNQYGVLPIQNGAVDGQDFFFVVVVKDEGEDFRMVYRGHIFQDEIQFRVEAGERQIDLIVKKQ
jgi:hypothetical protein